MLLADVVATSAAVAATRSRTQKSSALAAILRAAADGATDGAAIELVVRYLSGELRQRRAGVGWAMLRDLPPPAATPTLDVFDADRAFATAEAASGPGSVGRRRAAITSLFERATAEEQRFLVQLVGGELRQGAQAGVMTDAIAKAAGVPPAAVRRAAMLQGDLAEVSVHALLGGEAGLARSSRRHRARRRGPTSNACASSSRSRRSSSTRCTSTARTSSTVPRITGAARWRSSCRRRCGCRDARSTSGRRRRRSATVRWRTATRA